MDKLDIHKILRDYEDKFRRVIVNKINEIADVSGSEVSSASNGLTRVLHDVQMGGNLSQNTNVDGLNTYSLTHNDMVFWDANGQSGTNFGELYTSPTQSSMQWENTSNQKTSFVAVDTNKAEFYAGTFAGTVSSLRAYHTAQTVANNGVNNNLIVDDGISSKGIVYAADYSANFTNESLVSKRYVDSHAAISNTQIVYGNGTGITSSANLTFANNTLTVIDMNLGRGGGAVATNTSLGVSALNSNVIGARNTAIGYNALTGSTSDANTAVGTGALSGAVTGYGNCSIGNDGLKSNTSGNYNVSVGSVYDAVTLGANTSGSYNIGIGPGALTSQNGVNGSVAIGISALTSNVSGTGLTAVGFQALRLSTGANNAAFGYNAGVTITTGTNNTFLGNTADASVNNLTNATAVGYGASVGASNSLVLGSGANVGIGVSVPTAKLHIPAGTSTAGTAPIKLTAGTLLATPELGTMEYVDNGTTGHLYFTVNQGGVVTRVQIV